MIINLDPQFIEAARILEEVVHYQDKAAVLNDRTLIASNVRGLVVRLGSNLNKEFLQHFENLKFIATITTGLEHIDSDYCQKKGINIISLKGETEFLETIHATPEHTWALLLALVRRIPWAFDSVTKGKWSREDYFGTELKGKTIGIIGFGRIGRKVAAYAKAFEMQVKVYEKSEMPPSTGSLEELLSTSDIISLHIPLNEETENMLGRKQFSTMKNSAVLVNTSRGGVINETDLIEALENSAIAGAAIDVIADEHEDGAISADHPLIKYAKNHNNLLISPHIAGSTYESMENTARFIAQKIAAIFNRQKVN